MLVALKSISEESFKTDYGVDNRTIFIFAPKKRNVWGYDILNDFIAKKLFF